MADVRRFAPATGRNREPILEVLRRYVPKGATVLEIASGSGEHAVSLAPRLGVARWQPSDEDAGARASIDAWRAHVGEEAACVLPAMALDVTRPPSSIPRADVVVCINMIHIAPWEACEGLLGVASEALATGGVLYLYGPFKKGGAHTAPSNEAFDRSLRSTDPSWGVRDMDAVVDAARGRGFSLEAEVAMPKNNFSVVLRRSAPE